ncbi:hypothetical protein B0H14DRAFT_2631379 [Mycena olivaceomarginata]|nr:hypothetical protein B0H14DRAFT_2631379 [Mycena olivaceomarginata]
MTHPTKLVLLDNTFIGICQGTHTPAAFLAATLAPFPSIALAASVPNHLFIHPSSTPSICLSASPPEVSGTSICSHWHIVRSPSVLCTARRLMTPVDHLHHDGMSLDLPSETNTLPTVHQENLKFYQDPAGIIQVFGSLWWSMKTYCWSMSRALAPLSIVILRVVPGTMNIHHSASGKVLPMRWLRVLLTKSVKFNVKLG